MSDEGPNEYFRSSSFLQGQNAEYVEQLHSRFTSSPGSVDETWRRYFEAIDGEATESPRRLKPSWLRPDWPKPESGDLVAAFDGQWLDADPALGRELERKIRTIAADGGVSLPEREVQQRTVDSIRALMLIRAYRIRGHRIAKLDPLGLMHHTAHPELEPESYGFSQDDLDRPIFIDKVLGLEVASMREILAMVRRTYCGTFALQYMHISDPAQSSWLKERIEGYGKEVQFTKEGRRAILRKLIEAEGFEKFLQTKYTGTKRFGLDGAESVIPAMEQFIKRGGALGVKEIVIGMPHRGRLNILANVMGKPYRAILNEFKGGSFKPEDVAGSGDVKYHLGASSDREFDGNVVHLSLTANPSHLEAVKRRGPRQGQGQADPIRRCRGNLGSADPAARGRRVRRPGHRRRMLRAFRAGGPCHRGHDSSHRQQPDRLHDRSALFEILALSDRHRHDDGVADIPRQRR